MPQRVPLAKIYRAFPELDPFSDEECERYVAHVRQARRFSIRQLPYIAAAVGSILWLILFGTGFWLDVSRNRTGPEPVMIVVSLLWAGAGGYLAFLGVRDSTLRRALHGHINRTKCGKCGYSLLGLPVADGVTTCPECGAEIILADHHLTPEDLLARPAGASSSGQQEDPS